MDNNPAGPGPGYAADDHWRELRIDVRRRGKVDRRAGEIENAVGRDRGIDVLGVCFIVDDDFRIMRCAGVNRDRRSDSLGALRGDGFGTTDHDGFRGGAAGLYQDLAIDIEDLYPVLAVAEVDHD